MNEIRVTLNKIRVTVNEFFRVTMTEIRVTVQLDMQCEQPLEPVYRSPISLEIIGCLEYEVGRMICPLCDVRPVDESLLHHGGTRLQAVPSRREDRARSVAL